MEKNQINRTHMDVVASINSPNLGKRLSLEWRTLLEFLSRHGGPISGEPASEYNKLMKQVKRERGLGFIDRLETCYTSAEGSIGSWMLGEIAIGNVKVVRMSTLRFLIRAVFNLSVHLVDVTDVESLTMASFLVRPSLGDDAMYSNYDPLPTMSRSIWMELVRSFSRPDTIRKIIESKRNYVTYGPNEFEEVWGSGDALGLIVIPVVTPILSEIRAAVPNLGGSDALSHLCGELMDNKSRNPSTGEPLINAEALDPRLENIVSIIQKCRMCNYPLLLVEITEEEYIHIMRDSIQR